MEESNKNCFEALEEGFNLFYELEKQRSETTGDKSEIEKKIREVKNKNSVLREAIKECSFFFSRIYRLHNYFS